MVQDKEGKWVEAAKSQMKKQKKLFQGEKRKREKQADQAGEAALREKADAEAREKNLEEAKKIVIQEDKSLPTANMIKIRDGRQFREKRVKINGWVHRLRLESLFNSEIKVKLI